MVPAPPSLTSELPSALPPAPPPRVSPPLSGPDAPAPVWLQRLSLAVLVLFCFYIGALLAVLPWSPRYWDQNGWLLAHPAVAAVLHQGWVRGLVTGFGLIDIWIGISELLHYRDYRR
jgi:hypothetical protein